MARYRDDISGYDPAQDVAENVRQRVVKVAYEYAVAQGFDDEARRLRAEHDVERQARLADEMKESDAFDAPDVGAEIGRVIAR